MRFSKTALQRAALGAGIKISKGREIDIDDTSGREALGQHRTISSMSLDYATLDRLRQSHPAWRLLRSDHAPLVASFLQRVYAGHKRLLAKTCRQQRLQ